MSLQRRALCNPCKADGEELYCSALAHFSLRSGETQGRLPQRLWGAEIQHAFSRLVRSHGGVNDQGAVALTVGMQIRSRLPLKRYALWLPDLSRSWNPRHRPKFHSLKSRSLLRAVSWSLAPGFPMGAMSGWFELFQFPLETHTAPLSLTAMVVCSLSKR